MHRWIRKASSRLLAVRASAAAMRSYEQEHVFQRSSVLSECVECLEAAFLERAEERTMFVFAAAHDERHLGSEDERTALAIETKLLFEVAEEMTEIDV